MKEKSAAMTFKCNEGGPCSRFPGLEGSIVDRCPYSTTFEFVLRLYVYGRIGLICPIARSNTPS